MAPRTGTGTVVDGATAVELRGAWTVAAVARRLGVAPSTLRSWSLRYGIGPRGHEAGRHRRYSAADVTELDRMCHLVEGGMALAAAADVARADRASDAAADPVPHACPARGDGAMSASGPVGRVGSATVRRVVRAARCFATETISAALGVSFDSLGVIATWDQLCRPALVALADPRLRPDGCIDAELLLSWTIATSLRRLVIPEVVPGAGRVLLACGPGEHHSLPLEALAAALAESGVHVRMLGPAVPDTALLHAAEQLHPTAVVVWAQLARSAKPTQLRRLLDVTGVVVAAGPGWVDRSLPTAVARVHTLWEALDLATRRGRPPPGATPTSG
ncbi:MerR family transcriptional regulator [Pseudonocardia spinosispora]|uniref:MerR family transcriptional regulator n=1 Tax=Pseudonocardia spinosispora TaxID=103441 RepID=UPI0003F65818|nr:MerR family transcriptional regulator [Pseudonocardia spinosispora]